MLIKSKKGATLVELIVMIPLIALIVSGGIIAFIVAQRGFKTGTSEFNGNMQATLFKSMLDKNIPTAGSITFSDPEEGCTAIYFLDSNLVYSENFMTESEKNYLIGDVDSITVRIENSGSRCKLTYALILNDDEYNRSFNADMMLLNISQSEFSTENGGDFLPVEYTLTSENGVGLYIYPQAASDPGTPGGPDDPGDPTDPGSQNIYEDISYIFTANQHHGGFNYSLKLTNNSDEDVFGWVIEFDYNGTLTNAWNSSLEDLGNNRYRISSDSNTDVIKSGATVSSGGSGTIYGGEILSNVIIKRTYDINNINVTMDFSITSHWNKKKNNEGFNYQILLINNGSEAITGWSLEFDYDGIITGVWGSETFESLGNMRYRINCPYTYDYKIPANGGTVTIGGSGSVAGSDVTVATLNGISISVE